MNKYKYLCSMIRRVAFILSSLFILLACSKGEDLPKPGPERELSLPEKVEKEVTDVLSNDWGSLSDTLDYFTSTMLRKGKFRGKGPDGVYYEMKVNDEGGLGFKAEFIVEDSLFAAVSGHLIPTDISLQAFDTEFSIKKETSDSSSLTISKVKVIAPDCFLFEDGHRAPLLYEGSRVGFLTREEFENTDYTTGKYIVIHYYDDPRTFAIYDKGLAGLLKYDLGNVIR